MANQFPALRVLSAESGEAIHVGDTLVLDPVHGTTCGRADRTWRFVPTAAGWTVIDGPHEVNGSERPPPSPSDAGAAVPSLLHGDVVVLHCYGVVRYLERDWTEPASALTPSEDEACRTLWPIAYELRRGLVDIDWSAGSAVRICFRKSFDVVKTLAQLLPLAAASGLREVEVDFALLPREVAPYLALPLGPGWSARSLAFVIHSLAELPWPPTLERIHCGASPYWAADRSLEAACRRARHLHPSFSMTPATAGRMVDYAHPELELVEVPEGVSLRGVQRGGRLRIATGYLREDQDTSFSFVPGPVTDVASLLSMAATIGLRDNGRHESLWTLGGGGPAARFEPTINGRRGGGLLRDGDVLELSAGLLVRFVLPPAK